MARLNRDDLFTEPTLQGAAFCRALTERFDRWLRQLYVTATGAPDRVALVAVGGYGRAELCPQSDLDVLLHPRRPGRRRPAGREALVPDLGRGGEARPCGVHPQGGAAPGGRRAGHRDLAARRPPRGRRRRHHRPSWSAAARAQWIKGASTLAAQAEGRPDAAGDVAGRGGLRARARPQAGPRRPARRAHAALARGGRAGPARRRPCHLRAGPRASARGARGAAPAHRPAGRPAPAAGAGRRGRRPRLHGRRCADGERRHRRPARSGG